MPRRGVIVGSAIAFVVVVLAACGGSTTTPSAAECADGGSTDARADAPSDARAMGDAHASDASDASADVGAAQDGGCADAGSIACGNLSCASGTSFCRASGGGLTVDCGYP